MTHGSIAGSSVRRAGSGRAGAVKVVVTLKQEGGLNEPTVLGFRFEDGKGYQVRVPIIPDAPVLQLEEVGARVECSVQSATQATARVEILLPREPTQISVDPDGLRETRWAFRLGGAAALPLRGEFFALGGGDQFRGFDLTRRQGSLTWVGSVEWRVPLFKDMCLDVCDHLAGIRNLLAPFYDVGDAYVSGHSMGPTAHAVGVGLRIDVAWIGLIERTIIRFDVAKTIGGDSLVRRAAAVLRGGMPTLICYFLTHTLSGMPWQRLPERSRVQKRDPNGGENRLHCARDQDGQWSTSAVVSRPPYATSDKFDLLAAMVANDFS
jgi:hypothetical protein